jgi:hypothetical protein
MRKSLLILLAIELLVVVALGQIAHVDRPAMARAWAEWRQHPTIETRQAYERQKRTAEIQRWAFTGVVFAVLAVATVLIYRVRRGEPVASGDAGRRAREIPGSEARRA